MHTSWLFTRGSGGWRSSPPSGRRFAALRGQVGGDNSVADRWGLFAVTALDLQMLLGLILYLALSPNMRPILDNFGGAMKDPALRFWAVEHIAAMMGAVVAGARGSRARPEGSDDGVEAQAARSPASGWRPFSMISACPGRDGRAAVRCSAVYDPDYLSSLFSTWAAQVATLSWLGVALSPRSSRCPIPHFGSSSSVPAPSPRRPRRILGFGVAAADRDLRRRDGGVARGAALVVCRHLGGPGVPSRTEPLIGRHGIVTTRHRSDARHRPRDRRRRRLGGAEPRGDRPGTTCVLSAPTASCWRSHAMNGIVFLGIGLVSC